MADGAGLVASHKFVDEEERLAVRQKIDAGLVESLLENREVHGLPHSPYFLKTSAALCPPKPRFVESAVRICRATPTLGV